MFVGGGVVCRKLRIRARRSYVGDFENVNSNSAFAESIEFEFIFKVEPALDLLPEMRAFKQYNSTKHTCTKCTQTSVTHYAAILLQACTFWLLYQYIKLHLNGLFHDKKPLLRVLMLYTQLPVHLIPDQLL